MTSQDTRHRILDTARKLFNADGLHRVGVREVARAADVSVGNLSYYFATKDALVAALVRELSAQNAGDVFGPLPADFSLAALYAAALTAMRRTLAYRFVLLSYVDAVAASPELLALDAENTAKRRARSLDMIALLARNDYLHARAVLPRAERLFEQSELISSGWLRAAVRQPARFPDDDVAVLHFAKLGCALFEPYCTARGTRQLRRILAGDLDDALRPAPNRAPRAAKRRQPR